MDDTTHDRRWRAVQHTMKVTVRLSTEDHALLEHVAREERVPAAVLVRQILMAELRKRPGPAQPPQEPRP